MKKVYFGEGKVLITAYSNETIARILLEPSNGSGKIGELTTNKDRQIGVVLDEATVKDDAVLLIFSNKESLQELAYQIDCALKNEDLQHE
jgi:urease accessory protein UreE